jgi:Zn-dependent protease
METIAEQLAMIAYVFVLFAISLVLPPFKKISLSNRLGQELLSLIALCYVGLTALAYNIEKNVELNDQNPARNGLVWVGLAVTGSMSRSA